MDRFLHGVAVVVLDNQAVHLEVPEGVEGRANETAPVEHELVKVYGEQDLHQEVITLVFRQNVQHLIEHPNHFGCRGAMVELEKHPDTLEEEVEVVVRRDERIVSVYLREPLDCNVHRALYCVRIVCVRLRENYLGELV